MVKPYINHPDPEKAINAQVEVISAGERDPDAEGVEGMSASKLRGFVKDRDFESFKMGLPNLSDSEKKKMFNLIKKNLK